MKTGDATGAMGRPDVPEDERGAAVASDLSPSVPRFEDLRDFVAAIEDRNDLAVYRGAHWDNEMGAIAEIISSQRGPAVLFDEVPGYPTGYRVLANTFSTLPRSALAIRVSERLSGIQMLAAWRERLRNWQPVTPVEVPTGPIFENVMTGDAVDVFRFPTPRWNEYDGGRYIGTGNAIIVRDPDEGWVNLGAHRSMIHDAQTVGLGLVPGHHARLIADKWHARGLACPVVMTLGQEPAFWVATCYGLGWGESEYDLAGWLREAPVPVVRGPLTDLPIPATAEIALEGEIPPFPAASREEGPFGEWAGYYAGGERARHIMQVQAIYHRNDPILQGAPQLKPPGSIFLGVPLNAALLWDQLEACGNVGITGVWFHGTQWGALFTAVAIDQRYAGHAKQVAAAVMGCRAGAYNGKIVVVVDDDVDISNPDELLWAIATRTDCETVDVIRGVWTGGADPSTDPGRRRLGTPVSARLLIDACRPYSQRDTYPRVVAFSRDYREQVARKWGLTP